MRSSRMSPTVSPSRPDTLGDDPRGPVSSPRPTSSRDETASIEQVKALMLKLAAGERFERLGAIVQEHLLTGGKKLRAKLALAAVEALGVPNEHGVGWAASCELLHNASLVHDDLQDRDEYRRGRFSVWVRHGEAQAINAGDLLLMLPYTAVEHIDVDPAVKWELCRAVARRAEETVRGQSLEMTLLTSCRWDWASYDDAATGKTSALMTLPVHGAALIAGRTSEEATQLGDCFKDLGLLFQMQDDVIDLFGDKGRDKPGGDIREGRVSALVVEHLVQNPEDVAWLGPILGKPRSETTDTDVERVAKAFSGDTLQGVLRRILDTRARILSAPPLLAEPGLRRVAESLVDLSLAPIESHLSEIDHVG